MPYNMQSMKKVAHCSVTVQLSVTNTTAVTRNTGECHGYQLWLQGKLYLELGALIF